MEADAMRLGSASIEETSCEKTMARLPLQRARVVTESESSDPSFEAASYSEARPLLVGRKGEEFREGKRVRWEGKEQEARWMRVLIWSSEEAQAKWDARVSQSQKKKKKAEFPVTSSCGSS